MKNTKKGIQIEIEFASQVCNERVKRIKMFDNKYRKPSGSRFDSHDE